MSKMSQLWVEVEQEVQDHIPYCECIEELMDRVMRSSVAKYCEENLLPIIETTWFEHCS